MGILKQGFWWEFLARAVALNLRIVESARVGHRVRASGVTQVYRPVKALGAPAPRHLKMRSIGRLGSEDGQ